MSKVAPNNLALDPRLLSRPVAPARTASTRLVAQPNAGARDELSTGEGTSLRQRAQQQLAMVKLAVTATEAPVGSMKPSELFAAQKAERLMGPGSKGPEVERWQKDLVTLGYLSPRAAKEEKTFGARTAEATQEFKADHGLNHAPGVWGLAAKAMKQALSESGSHPKRVLKYDVPYITQMHSQGSADNWNENNNCGPTSLAMITKALGLHTHESDGKLINDLDHLTSDPTGGKTAYEMRDIARNPKTGLTSSEVQGPPKLEWIEKQLRAGKLVMAEGHRGVTLANDPTHPDSTAKGNHWIVIKGIAKNGDFLVNDPSTHCHRLSPSELERFFYKETSHGFALAIGKKGQ